MVRLLRVLICLLTAAVIESRFEVAAVRADHARLKAAYAKFLASNVHGATLESRLRPGSFGAFKAGDAVVVCGEMK